MRVIDAAHKLQNGEAVKFRPKGNSMSGRIESGQLITVVPIKRDSYASGFYSINDDLPLHNNDIVLCKVHGNYFVHLIKAIKTEGGNALYLIGNNHGHDNGWTQEKNIFGIVVKIEN